MSMSPSFGPGGSYPLCEEDVSGCNISSCDGDAVGRCSGDGADDENCRDIDLEGLSLKNWSPCMEGMWLLAAVPLPSPPGTMLGGAPLSRPLGLGCF